MRRERGKGTRVKYSNSDDSVRLCYFSLWKSNANNRKEIGQEYYARDRKDYARGKSGKQQNSFSYFYRRRVLPVTYSIYLMRSKALSRIINLAGIVKAIHNRWDLLA